jgi:hypothetical protein
LLFKTGIYRKTWLHSAPPVHLETDGIFAHGHVAAPPSRSTTAAAAQSAIVHRGTPALGSSATSAEVLASAEVVNTGSSAAKATLRFTLYDASGAAVGAAVSSSVSLPAAADKATPATAISVRRNKPTRQRFCRDIF